MPLDTKSFYGGITGDRARLRRRLEAAEAAVRSNSALRRRSGRSDIVGKDYPETYRDLESDEDLVA